MPSYKNLVDICSEDDSNSSNFIPEPYKYKKVFLHPMLKEKDDDAVLANIL